LVWVQLALAESRSALAKIHEVLGGLGLSPQVPIVIFSCQDSQVSSGWGFAPARLSWAPANVKVFNETYQVLPDRRAAPGVCS
jgi:hypothetical protein